MKKYTVIGLYPDSHWGDGMHEASFIDWVEALTPVAAAIAACEARKNFEDNLYAVDDFCVLAVFEGHHKDIYQPSVQSAAA